MLICEYCKDRLNSHGEKIVVIEKIEIEENDGQCCEWCNRRYEELERVILR